MEKEDLIYLHTVMIHVMRHLKSETNSADFSKYEAMNISPSHVHRTKADHERAVFLLSEEIVRTLNPGTVVKDRRAIAVNIREKGLADPEA